MGKGEWNQKVNGVDETQQVENKETGKEGGAEKALMYIYRAMELNTMGIK